MVTRQSLSWASTRKPVFGFLQSEIQTRIFASRKSGYGIFLQLTNDRGAFVVPKPAKTGFLASRPILCHECAYVALAI